MMNIYNKHSCIKCGREEYSLGGEIAEQWKDIGEVVIRKSSEIYEWVDVKGGGKICFDCKKEYKNALYSSYSINKTGTDICDFIKDNDIFISFKRLPKIYVHFVPTIVIRNGESHTEMLTSYKDCSLYSLEIEFYQNAQDQIKNTESIFNNGA